jgi:predicted ATPase
MGQYPRYLQSLDLVGDRVLDCDVHPFSVPSLHNLKLSFRSPITFLVGEIRSSSIATHSSILMTVQP